MLPSSFMDDALPDAIAHQDISMYVTSTEAPLRGPCLWRQCSAVLIGVQILMCCLPVLHEPVGTTGVVILLHARRQRQDSQRVGRRGGAFTCCRRLCGALSRAMRPAFFPKYREPQRSRGRRLRHEAEQYSVIEVRLRCINHRHRCVADPNSEYVRRCL